METIIGNDIEQAAKFLRYRRGCYSRTVYGLAGNTLKEPVLNIFM
jgi:hypothetical protein